MRELMTSEMTDIEVLKRWTVDELDMLHDISGIGPEWRTSARRAHLKKLEDDEMKILTGIVDQSLRVGDLILEIMEKTDE